MNTEYWLSEARLLEPYDLMVFCLISPADFFLYTEGGKLGPLLFNFILSNIVALGTGVSFSRFSGEREKREAGVEDELRASRAPRLTRACLCSPEKRKKKKQQQQRLFCKIRRNGRKLEKTTKSVGGRWVV